MDPVKTDDGQIVMVDPYGRVGSLPPAEIGTAFVQGYRFATADESHEQYLRNENSYSPVAAGAEGVARSASFGLYDVGAKALGLEENVAARRRMNSGAALMGEIGGYAVPGAAGKLLGNAGKAAVGAAGLGEAATIGGKIAAGAVRAGTEGALVGVQQTVSDVALSDHPLSAETIAAELGSNVLYGALTGAGVGGALGGLGGIISKASSRTHARAQVVSERMAAETETRAALSPAAQAAQAAAEAGPPKDWADLLRPSDFTPEEYARRKALLAKIDASEKAVAGRPGIDHDQIFPLAGEDGVEGWKDIVKARGEAKPGLPDEFFAPRGDTVVEAAKGEATANLRSPRAGDIEPPAGGGTMAEARPGATLAEGTPVAPPATEAVAPAPPAAVEPGYQPQGKLGNTLAGAPPRHLWPNIEAAYQQAQLHLSEVEERLEKVYRRDTLAGDDTIRANRRGLKPEAGQLPGLLRQHKVAVAQLVALGDQVEAIRAAAVEPTLRARPEPAPLERQSVAKTSSPGPQVPESSPAADLPRAPTARPLAMPEATAKAGPPEFIDDRTHRSGPPAFADPNDPLSGKTYREDPWRAERQAHAQEVANRKLGKKVLDPVGTAFKHLGGAAGWIAGTKIGHPWVMGGIGRWLGGAAADWLQGKPGKWDSGSARPAFAIALREHVGSALNGVSASVNRFVAAAPREVVASRAPQPATTLLQGFRYAPPSGQPDRPGPRDALGKSFAARADELARAVTDPEGTQQRIHRLLAALRLEDPKAANDVEATALRKLQFLWSVLPKNPALGTPLDGFARGQRPSDAQIAEFSRYAAAAETPKRLLEELNAGRLSPQTVAATKAVFPETFNAVRSEIMSHADQMQKLPYAQRVQLSNLFETPLDSTMQPETVAALQHTFAAEHGSPGGMAPPSKALGSTKKSTLAAPQPTQAQRLGE